MNMCEVVRRTANLCGGVKEQRGKGELTVHRLSWLASSKRKTFISPRVWELRMLSSGFQGTSPLLLRPQAQVSTEPLRDQLQKGTGTKESPGWLWGHNPHQILQHLTPNVTGLITRRKKETKPVIYSYSQGTYTVVCKKGQSPVGELTCSSSLLGWGPLTAFCMVVYVKRTPCRSQGFPSIPTHK